MTHNPCFMPSCARAGRACRRGLLVAPPSSSSAVGLPHGRDGKPVGVRSVNLSSVTLNVGDQKGTGAEAVLTAAGLLSTLPFHVNWSDFTSGPPMLRGDGLGFRRHRRRRRRPAGLRRVRRRAVEIVGARETSGDQDAVVVPKNSPITSIHS